MTRLVRILAAALLATAISACGDEAPKGEPLHLNGEVQANNGNGNGNGGGSGSSLNVTDPNIGLIWSVWDETTYEPVAVTQVAPLASAQLPVQFSVSILGAPPADALLDLYDVNGNVDGSIGFAQIIALDDVNSDDAFALTESGLASPDLIFGISWRHAVLYVDALPSTETAGWYFANPEALAVGYQLVEIDFCTGQMRLLASGTSVEIDAFEPVAELTEDHFPEELWDECEWEEPTEPGRPDPTCWQDAAQTCSETTCRTDVEAFWTCLADNACDPTGQDWSCIEQNCMVQYEAAFTCVDQCSWEICDDVGVPPGEYPEDPCSEEINACFEVECFDTLTALQTCYDANGCDQDMSGTCMDQHCATEIEAANTCLEACIADAESCTGVDDGGGR